MNKKGYPNGNPEDDRQKLHAWWTEELESCKYKGNIEVEYASSDEESEQKSAARKIFDAVTGNPSTTNAHLYHSVIPHPNWPMEAVVTTTQDGLVTGILYEATIDRELPGPVRFTLQSKAFSWKWVATGEGASALEGNKKLLKILKKSLCRSYETPGKGFTQGNSTFVSNGIFIDLTPDGEKTRVIACTTPHATKRFVGYTWSLGLAPVTELLETIEKA